MLKVAPMLLLLTACGGVVLSPLDDPRTSDAGSDAGQAPVLDGAVSTGPCYSPPNQDTFYWYCNVDRAPLVVLWVCPGLTAETVNAGPCQAGTSNYPNGVLLCCPPELPVTEWPTPKDPCSAPDRDVQCGAGYEGWLCSSAPAGCFASFPGTWCCPTK